MSYSPIVPKLAQFQSCTAYSHARKSYAYDQNFIGYPISFIVGVLGSWQLGNAVNPEQRVFLVLGSGLGLTCLTALGSLFFTLEESSQSLNWCERKVEEYGSYQELAQDSLRDPSIDKENAYSLTSTILKWVKSFFV